MTQKPHRKARPAPPQAVRKRGWAAWAGDHRKWIAIGGGAAALAASAVVNHLNARKAEAKTPPAGRFVSVDGVELHYTDRGAGPVVVLLHGNGVSLQDYEASGVTEALAGTHRVIAFDRPGFGYSSRPRTVIWTPTAQAGAIVAALRAIGVERAVVVGHSWGAMVALAMALDHPGSVDGLVLLSGYYYPTLRPDVPLVATVAIPVLGDLMAHTVSPLSGALLEPGATKASFAPADINPAFRERAMALSLRPSQVRATAADTALMIPGARSLSHRYGELRVPTVVMAGEGDLIAHANRHAERLVADIAGSSLRLFPGQGHLLHYAMPEAVADAVAEVAARRDAA